MRRTKLRLPLLMAISAGLPGACVAEAGLFTQEIKPLLARRCFTCHGPDQGEGGLHLHKRRSAVEELDSGARAIVPGDVGASELLARVTSSDESLRMPPEGDPLTAKEVAALRRWVEAGAPWETHWAFRAPARGKPPRVREQAWVRNPIDAFLLHKLEAQGLSPAPPADRRTLARRAYYNLTGLPPSEEQLQAFQDDNRAGAFGRLVDELLDSPHYGERWARHWLDVVRYAESNSFERDSPKPNVWKYRDYVIRSFNEDKPYDQFLIEQLAGDELDQVTRETMIATGYYRLGIWDDEPADPVQAYADEIDDLITTTGKAMLGLTINCARCHDHKIDPIPQENYYGFAAFFADVTSFGVRSDQKSANQWEIADDALRKKHDTLAQQERALVAERRAIEQAGIARMPAPVQRQTETRARERVLKEKLDAHLTPEERVAYAEAQASVEAVRREIKELPATEKVLALAKARLPLQPTHVAIRGNPHVAGPEVQPHFPEILGGGAPEIQSPDPQARTAGRRRILAEWIASPENMLTARVIVNRVWQHHFGRGIVRSSSNFGELGTPPTHPELLDWLALWLIDHDWRLKPLHRLMMDSAAYRMSSRAHSEALLADPANDLWSHFDLRRLDAEEIRDTALAVTGELNRAVYGPSIYTDLSAEVLATQSQPGNNWGKSTDQERARRSIYIHVKRSLIDPLIAAFDFPDTDVSCEGRYTTTQPGQALALLNGVFFNDRAKKLSERVLADASQPPEHQIAAAVRLALGRGPSRSELDEGLALYQLLVHKHGRDPSDALRYWCLTVLNFNELIYLD